MPIPTEPNYPESYDSDLTLFADPTNAITLTLKYDIGAGDTSFDVNESVSSINVPTFLVFETGEIVYATSKDNLAQSFSAVVRSGSPQPHTAGELIRQTVVAEYFMQIKRTLIAIENAIGLNPAGSYATMVARLAEAENDIATHGHVIAPSDISPQGAGSTLNADKLDGQEGAYYINPANHSAAHTPAQISPQGAGSNLDADTVDGYDAADLLTPSHASIRYFHAQLNGDTALEVKDNAAEFVVPDEFDGWKITGVIAARRSGTGVPAFQIRNVTDGVDVLSTKVTIDSGETSSKTAATPPVINTSNNTLAAGDLFAVDTDVAGTSTLGARVIIKVQPA